MRKYEWRPVRGYEDKYAINHKGDVKILSGRNKVGKLRKWDISNLGYASVNLYKDNRSRKGLIHRLVAEAFIPNPNNLPVVNHKDFNPLNNNVDNLEWTTQGENVEYSRRMGRATKYIAARLTLDQVRKIRQLRNNISASELAKIYKVTPHTIRDICTRRTFADVK